MPPGKRRTRLEHWQDDLIESFETRLFTVTKPIADRWAVLAAKAQRKGITVANIDGLIAATALDHDLTLVTRNVKDFVGVEVPIVNPWES
jgi:predicted nucleic acid-binding protein